MLLLNPISIIKNICTITDQNTILQEICVGVPLLINHYLDSLTTEKVGTGPRFQEGNRFIDRKLMVIVIMGETVTRRHCRLSICEYWLSWTNTVSEQKIPISILILKRGPCLSVTFLACVRRDFYWC